MKKNIGSTDKLVRILAGMVALGFGFYNPEFWLVFILGLYPLFTGIYGYSPVYAILHVTTCHDKACTS